MGGILQAIRGKPGVSATAAKPVLALWRALERPPLTGFVEDVKLVASAAHSCPHGLFARDIRAEGWPEGTPRQRDPATICVQKRWDARLQAARDWVEDGKPGDPAAQPAESLYDHPEDTRAHKQPHECRKVTRQEYADIRRRMLQEARR